MSESLRRAPVVLLAALLGCDRRAATAWDGGPPAPLRAGPSAAPVGSVGGRVSWRGAPPVLPRLGTSASVQSVCGPSVADNALRVDAQGGMADVVVWVDAPPAGTASAAQAQEPVLDQRSCLYQPAVLAARAGGTVRLRNSDPLTHTVHAFSLGQTLFDVAMPLEHMEFSRRLPVQPGVVDIRCDVHPWMHAVVRTFDHPHFTSSDSAGQFRLPGLEPGEVNVHAWHPRLGEVSRRVHVGGGETRTDFDFGGMP